MKAAQTANTLQQHGVASVGIEECQDRIDGAVYITDSVHVQVHTNGNALNVVREYADGSFQFFPDRSAIGDIISDIKNASA